MMMSGYTKHIADLAQQIQFICPDGLPNFGLRPSRNTWICVGATAAACVAIGAAVKALRGRRSAAKKTSAIAKKEIKCIVLGDMPKNGKRIDKEPKNILKRRQGGDEISDCESELEAEVANIKLNRNVNARIHQAFYTRCDVQGMPLANPLD